MVKQLWQGILLPDTKAHRPTAKIAKNNSEHRTNTMLKCLSAHLHTTSYLARVLAKTRNRFKRAAIRAYATAKATTPANFGVKCSVLVLHPCISEDGLFLAPNCETMRSTHAFRNSASEHTNNHQIYKQTNNSSGDAGPNSQALAHKMPFSNLLAMAPQKTTTPSTPCLQDMPDGPYEDLLTGKQETLPQQATQRSNAIAFLGNWRRGHALKILLTAVMSNKAHNQRHAALKKWAHYTRTTTTTANLAARTVYTSLTEALRKWQCLPTINNKRRNTKNLAGAITARLNTQNKTIVFNNWWQHAQDSSTARRPHVQLSLRGLAAETLMITVPVPVTRQHLHRIIAKKTLVPPQEQSLGSMHHYAVAQNADLFYIEKNKTLDLSLLLNGGSGSSRPPKHAKPLTHQAQKFHIYANGPDQHQNALLVLPSDKIRRVKELLEDRVGLKPSFQTIFLRGTQIDDNLTLQDCEITEGTTLQLLRATPPMNCEWHDKRRNPEHLMQKLDPDFKQWIWVCCPGSVCRMEGPSQKSVGAATNAPTQHPVTSRAKRTTTHAQEDTAAAETILGAHHQTPLLDTSTSFNIGTRVYARFTDGQEYTATILGAYRGGYFVAYDEEPEVSYRVKNDRIRPWHPPPTRPAPEPPTSDQMLCGLHNRSRSISNLKWQAHPISNIFQMICKPTQECAPRVTHHKDTDQQDQRIRSAPLTFQNNPETGTEDTSSTSSWDEAARHRLSVSAKATINSKEQQRGKTSLETKASTVLRTAPPKLARTTPASAPASIPRTRVRQDAPLNTDDLSAGMNDTRRAHPQQTGPLGERFSLRELNSGKQAGNFLKPAASNVTRAEGTQQPPSISQNSTTPQLELHNMLEALEQLAFLNETTGHDAASQLTPNQEPPAPSPPQAKAPTLPLPRTTAHHIDFFVHGAGHSLEFRQRSPDLLIGRLKQEISHRTSMLGTSIPAAEQALSFKGKIMEDTAALRDYNLQQNALNIIDLSTGMSAAATPSSAPHTPYPPAAPTLAATMAVLPLSDATNARTSSAEDATSHSEPEQTTTRIFYDRTLDEYSSAALQPELSEVLTALAQLSTMKTKTEQPTIPQEAPTSQRQVTGAPTDHQLLDAPPKPTPPQMEMDESSAEEMIPAPRAHELPSQAASFDMPMPQMSTLTTLVQGPRTPKEDTDVIQFFVKTLDGSSITMRDSLDATGGQLKARLEAKTGIPAVQQRLTYIKEIQDLDTLREISLPANGTIHMSLRLTGGMEKANTQRQVTCNTSIYVRSLGISVTRTLQGYEITGIAPNSPADKDERISRGQLLLKIDDSFGNLRDLDSVGKALQGTPPTPVTLWLKSPLTTKAFKITLVRQQNHPAGPASEAGGESPRTPSHSPRAEHAKQAQPLDDTSPPPENLDQQPDKESQPPPQDQAYTRALLDSINLLLLSGGQPKDKYVPQRQLARKFYYELRHTGSGAEVKRRLQQKYGEWGAFSRFLKACTHPNGEPLLEWRDDTFQELRLTVPTRRTSFAPSLRTAAKAWGLPPRSDDLQDGSNSKPKKPRHATTTTPLSSPIPEEDLPPPIKASLIKIFCNLWVPDFDPKTATNLRRAVERHMLLPEDIYLSVERQLALCYNKLAKLHRERINSGKPPPRVQDMEECLNINHDRMYRRGTAFAFRQKLPCGRSYQDFHEGDFIYIRHHDSPQTQLVQILHALAPTPAVATGAAKKALPCFQALLVQPWTDLAGQYLQDKTERLVITAQQAWRRQTTAFPDTTLDTDTFFENAAQLSHLTYLDLLMYTRVSKPWKQAAIKGMRHLRALSLNPTGTARGPHWHPQAHDADLAMALQRTDPQQLRVMDLRSQNSISPPAIRRLLESHPGLGHMLISSPALAFTAVATKMRTLPCLRDTRPYFFAKALLSLIRSKERATVEADIDPQEGPTSLQYLLDELALRPGTQLSIDPELVPPLHVLHNSARWNEWATLALFVHGRLGPERARRDTQAPDQQGDTALLIACAHGSSEAVEILLSDPNNSVAHALVKSNHMANTPIMAACRAGYPDLVTLLLHSAPTTINVGKLLREVRYDGHTFMTAAIASQNASLLQLALDQPPFALIDSSQLRVSATYQEKLRALANAATCPTQLEKWLRCADELSDKLPATKQRAKHSVLRTLATIIAAPATPTPIKTALTNILAIMAQHWSLLSNPSQLSPLLRLRLGAQYALPWSPSILLAQLGAQGKGQSVSQPSPKPTRDLYLPTRTISPTKESKQCNLNRDVLISKSATLCMALSHDSLTLVRQEAGLLAAVDTDTGLTTALKTTKQWGNTGALNFISLQWEDQPSAAGNFSVLLVDEKGTVFRWTPAQNTLQADYQHTDLPDTEALQECAVAFTRNASALAYVSRDGTLHVSHFRPAAEGCNPTAGLTSRRNTSRWPVSKQGIHAVALSNSLLALSTTSGTTLWDGVRRDSHATDGVADFICRRALGSRDGEKDKKEPRGEPCSLAFSNNGEYLATGYGGERLGAGPVIEIWNTVPGTLAFRFSTTHQNGVHSLAFSTDTLLVSAGGDDHTTQVWHLDTHTAQRSTPLLGRSAKITGLVASDRLIMASSADLTTLIWNVPHAPPKSAPHKEEVKAVAVSPSHANPSSIFGATATAAGQTVKIWDSQDTLQATISHTETIQAIIFSSSGEKLIVAGGIPSIYVHASSTGQLLLRVASLQPSQDSAAYFTALAVSENDKYLAAGTSTGAIARWTNAIPPPQQHNRSRAQQHPLEAQAGHPACDHIVGHLKSISRLEFLDENTLLSRSTDNALRMWDTRSAGCASTNQHPLTLTGFSREGQRKGILDIRFRGNRLIIAMPTHPVAFYLASTSITAVACQGTRILIGGKDGSVTHAEAPWLDLPQARACIPTRTLRIDISRFLGEGEMEQNFSITAPTHLSLRNVRTIAASRVSRPTAEVFLSTDTHIAAQGNQEDEPIYQFNLSETIYASPEPFAADRLISPHEPQAIIKLFVSPPLDLAQNPPNKNKERTFRIDIPVSSTIAILQAIVARRTNLHESWFHLIASGSAFSGPLEVFSPDTGETLLAKGIVDGDTIHVHLRLRAGSETYPGYSQPGTEEDAHPPHNENMQILVTTYYGKTSAIPAKPTDTIESVKRTLAEQQGVPIWQQRIVYEGTDLLNEQTLEHCKIHNNSALAQLLHLRGGMDAFKMYQQRAQKQAALRREEEAAHDPSGFAKTDAHQQEIQQKNQEKKWLKKSEHGSRHTRKQSSTASLKPWASKKQMQQHAR